MRSERQRDVQEREVAWLSRAEGGVRSAYATRVSVRGREQSEGRCVRLRLVVWDAPDGRQALSIVDALFLEASVAVVLAAVGG